MRQKVTADRLAKFMESLGRGQRKKTRVYLVGGATAVLLGWRDATIDIDLKIVPEIDEALRKLPQIKEDLELNVELASPDDFVPALPGWEERSTYIRSEGAIEFFHYDFYGQALAKIERGHTTDRRDVDEMINRGLVEPARLLELFSRVEDQIYKYPAIDAKSLRHAVEQLATERG
jgi:hypothetical protein